MRVTLLSAIAAACVLSSPVINRADAAPVAGAAIQQSSPATSGLLEHVYYYHGRYYPYRYHGHYYAHRRYRHGHWSYY